MNARQAHRNGGRRLNGTVGAGWRAGFRRAAWLLAALALPYGAAAATYYVTLDGSDTSGDGSAGNPWRTVSNALAQATGTDTVVVSNGTYDLETQLVVTAGITLRSFEDDPATVVINGDNNTGRLVTNRCLLVTHADAWISGLTFSNGYAIADLGGGGIRMTGGTVSNCVVTHCYSSNNAIHGAGLYMGGGQVLNSRVQYCAMNNYLTVPVGGGIYMAANATVRDCTLAMNRYKTGSGSGRGIGVFMANGGVVEDCLFTNNIGYNGIILVDYYGIVSGCRFYNNTNTEGVIRVYYDHANPAIITNCDIVSNTCGFAIMRMTRQTEMTDCTISHNTMSHNGSATLPIAALAALQINPAKTNRIRNCRILNNRSTHATPFYDYYGPGVYAISNTLLENCLVAGNNRGGVYVETNAGGVSLSSCTVAGNTNYGVFLNTLDGYQATVTNCIVYSNTPVNVSNRLDAATNWYGHCCAPDALPTAQGNIAADPLFADTTTNDFRLLPGSPCVDAGINLPWMEAGTDLDGAPRIRHRFVDIGAFESPPPAGTVFMAR